MSDERDELTDPAIEIPSQSAECVIAFLTCLVEDGALHWSEALIRAHQAGVEGNILALVPVSKPLFNKAPPQGEA